LLAISIGFVVWRLKKCTCRKADSKDEGVAKGMARDEVEDEYGGIEENRVTVVEWR